MERPYIICHMVTSIDGKVTGKFLTHPACAQATEVYYELNRSIKAQGFICGRVTMEGSFTEGWYPALSDYRPREKKDFIPEDLNGFYAVAFDTRGRLGWKRDRIIDPDGDPGYDGARIVEILSEQADARYLGYLRQMGIPYLFAGEEQIDVSVALHKLKTLLGIDRLLLEGGSILNGSFQRADAIDALSLVVAPLAGDADGQPLFAESTVAEFELTAAETQNGTVILNYKRK